MTIMRPVTQEEKKNFIESFNKALSTKKEIRTNAIKKAKSDCNQNYKASIPKLHPVPKNAHLLALIVKDSTYKKLLKSYKSPTSLWLQLSELYRVKFEFWHIQTLLRVQQYLSETPTKLKSLRKSQFFDLVVLFNNGEYDSDVALTLSVQIERAFANCQTEMVSGGDGRDGEITNPYI